MTGRALKWIAAITMVIDHFSVVCLGSLMEGVPDLSIPSLYAGAVSGDGQQALLYWQDFLSHFLFSADRRLLPHQKSQKIYGKTRPFCPDFRNPF